MFSIIIPIYNKEHSIKRTVNSILMQSGAKFEIIVVNDGSTDNSLTVLNEIKDSRLKIIDQQNSGVSSARNTGIQNSQYQHIALIDADDIWAPGYILEQMKMIEDFPEAAMWGINFAEMYDGKLVRKLETGLPDGYRGIVDDYFSMPAKKGRVSDLFCSSSVVIRKSAFEKAGYFDERLKYSEDIDMWYRIIANFPVAFYDKYMVFYQYDAENRAMNRKRLLKYWLPFYADKYSSYKGNEPFYSFIQRWCAVKIKECYFNDPEQREDAKDASTRLDYSVLPAKYKYFFSTPYCVGRMIYWVGEAKNKLFK